MEFHAQMAEDAPVPKALGALLLSLVVASPSSAAAPKRPIIDMHLHAHGLDEYGGGGSVCTSDQALSFPPVDPRGGITIEKAEACEKPVAAAASDEAVMRESLAMLDRYDIVAAVTSGQLARVSAWRAAGGAKILPAISFAGDTPMSVAELRRLHQEGKFAVFAEIGAQYRGRTLDDPMYEPYFALAEELDIPVGVHLGEGPPGGPHTGDPRYRARLGHPLQLEEVLVRHPKLRLWVMHYGSPFVDEMIALLYSHPQVYVDVAQNDWGFPRAHFYSQLKRLIDAGFAKRILWGSDQMVWPQTIPVAIETIEQAPFLSEEQKRDIFHDNAARFLRMPASPAAGPR